MISRDFLDNCHTERARYEVLQHWRDACGERPTTISEFCTATAGDPTHRDLTKYGKQATGREWMVLYQLCLDLANMGLLRPEGGTEDHVQLFVARMPWMEVAG